MKAPIHRCHCGAQYKVVRQEAPSVSNHSKEIACLSCGAPLEAHEGKFVLKYFRVKLAAEELRSR